jgi:hypothetical protein
MKTLLPFFFFSLCVLLSGCCKKDTPQPLDQLPPATQEGKNTFGCLLNGQAWTPKGYSGYSNYSVVYDPTFNEGNFNLKVYRIEKQNDNSDIQYFLTLVMDTLSQPGTYSLNSPNLRGGAYYMIVRSNNQVICDYTYENQIYRRGSLTITRLDLNKGIISGTFEFTLAKPGCDTIRVTNGRFDKQL